MTEEKTIQERKEKIINYLKEKNNWIVYLILAFILWLGAFIRTRGLPALQNKYPLSIDDPFIFMRYAEYIVEHGKLMAVDMMRNYPLGFNLGRETPLLHYTIAYLYKIVHFFSSSFTVKMAAIWYPVVFFVLMGIVFFLLVRRLFDYKIALLATAFLAVIPAFLFRTTAGFSDKEPLAFFFMFLIFYFYVVGWQSKKIEKNILFGILAGVATTFMGLTWGGSTFVALMIPSFVLMEILLNKFTRNELYLYTSWLFVSLILILAILPERMGIKDTLSNINTLYEFFILLIIGVTFLLQTKFFKEKIKWNLPNPIKSLVLSTIIAIVLSSVVFGFSFLKQIIAAVLHRLLTLGQNRWALTVAESHQPYVTDWISNFTELYFYLFIIASIILFYEVLKPIENKKYKFIYSGIYILFIFSFIFSRYSSSSTILNGQTTFSSFLYIGSLLFFMLSILWGYIYCYQKRKEIFEKILNIDKKYTFLFIWFFISVASARTAIRLLILFVPITTIFISYLLVSLYNHSFEFKEKIYKIATWAVLIILIYLTLVSFVKVSYATAGGMGTGFTPQWQNAMDWVKNETPKDSVFASWWDYGYVIQAAGERATVTDPGNAIVYWNHLLGRHLLLANNSKEALEFLKTHKVNYVLIEQEDIGKYPAYASIGADENYDRYSYITSFSLDPSQTQETRNETVYVYRGGYPLDEDFIYQNIIFPAGQAGIGLIAVPILKGDNNTFGLNKPSAVMVFQGKQYTVPVKCVYFNNQIYNFEGEGLDACLRIIPTIANNQMNPFGAMYYLSSRVKNTLFGQLYLMNQKWDGFEVAYSDENNIPLALYNGYQIGPIKIWKVTYSNDIKEKPEYLETAYPDARLTEAR